MNNNKIPNKIQSVQRPYFPSLNTELDGWIDWSESPDSILKIIQAFGWPYSGASTTIELSNRSDRNTIKIARASVAKQAKTVKFHSKTNGCIIRLEKSGDAHITCNGGVLIIHSLRDGIKEIPANKILRLGMRLK